MKKANRIRIILLLLMALLLTGCSMRTADQMYSIPMRSEADGNLQAVIDQAMSGLDYCAPRAGENQQAVQMADLDGDGVSEYLLFAKGSDERPLRILIFKYSNNTFQHVDTIESNGTAFDQVEYVQMDNNGGYELVVGRLLDAQVLGSVSVYNVVNREVQILLSANYSKFVTVDLDADGLSELFVLRPGQTETDRGIAEMYGMEQGVIERSNEVNMSESVSQLKRVIVGKLHGGQTAIYTASAVGDSALITDVYTVTDGMLKNVSISNESGTSMQTMRNYYVYADDIDNDGVVELPQLMPMHMQDEGRLATDRYEIIRWYAMTVNGEEVDKMFTFHNFVGGWYLQLEDRWARKLTVQRVGSDYCFYIWDRYDQQAEHVLTVHALTGQNRDIQATQDGRFLLHKTDTVVYAATLMQGAENYDISQEYMIRSFQLIKQDWKTGET